MTSARRPAKKLKHLSLDGQRVTRAGDPCSLQHGLGRRAKSGVSFAVPCQVEQQFSPALPFPMHPVRLRSVDLTGGMSVNSIEKALALRSQQRLPSRIKMAPKALNLKPQDCRGMLGKSQVPHGGMRARESGNFAASASKVPWLLWSGHSQYHCHSEGGHYSHKMRALMSGRTVTGMSKTGLLTMKVLLV